MIADPSPVRIGVTDPSGMSPEQRDVYDRIASGQRQDVPQPFMAMLDAPLIADAIQGVGNAVRFAGVLEDRHREVAILATAAAQDSGYEWEYHLAIARRLGVDQRTIDAARNGAAERIDDRIDRLTIRICRSSVLERRINDEDIANLIALTSKRAATEVVAIAGYYPMLALFLSAARLDHAVA